MRAAAVVLGRRPGPGRGRGGDSPARFIPADVSPLDPLVFAGTATLTTLLRVLVDLTTALIAQSRPARDEAQRLVAAARRRILELFPDKESMYELILAPRCARLLEEIPEPTGRVLPFHAR